MACRALVVDDSVAIRGVLMYMLRSDGFACVEASNGAEALRALDAGEIDVVVSDLWMPGVNGLDLVKSIRSNSIHSGVPVVILTTDVHPARTDEAMAAGATCVLHKPVTREQFLAAVTSASS